MDIFKVIKNKKLYFFINILIFISEELIYLKKNFYKIYVDF